MSERRVVISRPLVAVIAATCLATALVMWLCWPDEGLWYGSFLRVGVLMVVFWWALPAPGQESTWPKISPWTMVAIVVAIILLPRYKQVIIPLLIALIVVGFVLRPRARFRPPPPPS